MPTYTALMHMHRAVKRKLRPKNRLMRAARVEEASALAIQIAKDITRRNARSLNKLQASSLGSMGQSSTTNQET